MKETDKMEFKFLIWGS